MTMDKEAARGRTIWASFNWTRKLDVETAANQQEALTRLVDDQQIVINTAARWRKCWTHGRVADDAAADPGPVFGRSVTFGDRTVLEPFQLHTARPAKTRG